MSTRERAQLLFNRLSDEQIEELVEYIEDNFLPEPPNAVHSKAEIEKMLAEAEDDVRNGRVMSWEEAKADFRETFGL